MSSNDQSIMAIDSRQLADEIEVAFSEVSYPGDENLVDDKSGTYPDVDELAAAFSGKKWRDLSIDMLRHYCQELIFFTPEAYHYFIPAFLLAALLHRQESEPTPGFVVLTISPPMRGTLSLEELQSIGELHRKRISCFTPAQRQAITRWLMLERQKFHPSDPFGTIGRAIEALNSNRK